MGLIRSFIAYDGNELEIEIAANKINELPSNFHEK